MMLASLNKMFFALGLCGSLVLLGSYTSASPVHAVTCSGTTVNSWTSLVSALPVSGSRTICLDQAINHVVGSGLTDNLSIATGSQVTLDLAGNNLTVDSRLGAFVAGINVPSGAGLTILDSVGGGTLTAQAGEASAGIGGNQYQSSGSITILSGIINAEGGPATYVGGAGIGSGAGGGPQTIQPTTGDITISGGTVTARSYATSAGIGGGYLGSGGTIRISGGTVTGVGIDGAGIGSGYDGGTFNILITGGTVIGDGGTSFGAGIGAGSLGVAGTISISGGAHVTGIAGTQQVLSPLQGIGPTSGGNASVVTIGQSTIVTTGSSLTLGAGPSISGGTFAGWIVSGSNTLIQPASTITFSGTSQTKSITPGVTTSVSYNSNGGTTPAPATSSYTSLGSAVTVASGSSISRAGYTFTGWNTVADGSGTGYQPGSVISPSVNTELFAQWAVAPLAQTGTEGWTQLATLGLALLTLGFILKVSGKRRSEI